MALVGIDLGTSNSAAAVLRGGRPVIIPSAEGVSLGGKALPDRFVDSAGQQHARAYCSRSASKRSFVSTTLSSRAAAASPSSLMACVACRIFWSSSAKCASSVGNNAPASCTKRNALVSALSAAT